MKVWSYTPERGPRVVVSLGGVEHVLTVEEATELRDGVSMALRELQPAISRADDLLHRQRCHPGYEYETTTNSSRSSESPMPDGDGWEPNVHVTDDGRNWERFDYYEENYWMRKKPRRGES